MKWVLIFLTLSISDDVCNRPGTLVKHSDELYDSQEECEAAFQASRFYKARLPGEIVGLCLGPLKPLMLSPDQRVDRPDSPKCP